MSTEQLLFRQILVVDVTEIECIWDNCTREGLLVPVLTWPCACSLPHCLPHKDEMDALQANAPPRTPGLMCATCLETVGFILRWERVK